MGILQQNSGTFNGSPFTVTLPTASSATNRVVVVVAANTIINTPAGWTLRSSQVNWMGHYMWDRPGGATGWTFTGSNGQGTWWIAEIPGGTYDNSTGTNTTSGSPTFATPPLTPAAGDRTLLASIGSTNGVSTRTMSGWTGGFVEQVDVCYVGADNPNQGGAALDVAADGSTAYSTSATYSTGSFGRSSLIGSYGYTGGGGGAVTGMLATQLPAPSTHAGGVLSLAGAAGCLLPALAAAAVGVAALTGTSAATLPAPVTSGAAQVTTAGTTTATIPGLTTAAAGTLAVTGAGSATAPALAGTGTMDLTVTGSAAATLPPLTSHATSGEPPDTGSAAATIPRLATGAHGTLTASGHAAADLPALACTAGMALLDRGSITLTIPPLAGGRGPFVAPPEFTNPGATLTGNLVTAMLTANAASAALTVNPAGATLHNTTHTAAWRHPDMSKWKTGDTWPPLEMTLTDAGQPVDLSTATAVAFHSAPTAPASITINAAMQVADAAAGAVRYLWQPGDLDQVGTFRAEAEVTWGDGTIQTFPPDSYLAYTVAAQLDEPA